MKPGGFIKLATDKPDLAEWIRDIFDVMPGLRGVAGTGGFINQDTDQPETKLEQRDPKEGRICQLLHYFKR